MSRLRTLLFAGTLVLATVLPASAADTIVCPPLGPREEAIAFFTDRGFPAGVEDQLTDGGASWTSVLGPMTAVVQGEELAHRIDFSARFSTIWDSEEDGWSPWSVAELVNALTWATELIDTYASAHLDDRHDPDLYQRDPGDPTAPILPGGVTIDEIDRDAVLDVSAVPEALVVHAEVVAKTRPRLTCEEAQTFD